MGATDRWQFWPVATSLVSVTIITFICGLPGSVSFLLIPLTVLLLVYPVAAIALLIIAIFFAVRKRPHEAASFLFALMPVLFWRSILQATMYAHLALTALFGLGQLGSTPPNSQGFAVYDWSVGLAGGPNTFLIHDETDEIALPMAKHTHPASDENGFGEECAGKVDHLLGHYYICTF